MKGYLGRAALGLLIALCAGAAMASSRGLARDLGAFLGSEAICKLQINYARVQSYIRDNVPANDLEFANELRVQAELVEFRYDKMTTSMRVAYCEQMERAGKSLNLIN